jgi:Fe-S-cluster containining protein
MIQLEVQDDAIELRQYSNDATLQDLVDSTERIRLSKGLRTEHCYGCGICCKEPIPVLGYDLDKLTSRLGLSREALLDRYLDRPEVPCSEERNKAIRELERQHDLTALEATLVYEFNRAEPIILARDENGTCIFLRDNLCTIYEDRPYICRLYLCNMAEKLSVLYEKIAAQGIWHSYWALGWTRSEDIRHNPFLKGRCYREVYMNDFEFDLKNALERLFFYF